MSYTVTNVPFSISSSQITSKYNQPKLLPHGYSIFTINQKKKKKKKKKKRTGNYTINKDSLDSELGTAI
jgi:hypothetical protein